MKRCIVTQSAVEKIHRESLLASGLGEETGGILIGPPPTDSAVVITSATGPGPADRCASLASWETDPDYLNEKLKRIREENPALNFRGFWHRHPGLMTYPSGQDLLEARKILADAEHYKLNGELVMPIVAVTQGRITIQCYYISSHDLWFKKIPMDVVSDGDEVVKMLLSGRKAVKVEQEAGFMFWQDKDWQFYKSPYGAVRLGEELSGLELAGYKSAVRLLSDNNCCIEAWKGGEHQRLLFLLPREYPLNPPRVFMMCDEDVQKLETDSHTPLCRWSSNFYLAELVAALAEQFLMRGYTRSARPRMLVNIKESFRHGSCEIPKLFRQLARFIRGKRNASGNLR